MQSEMRILYEKKKIAYYIFLEPKQQPQSKTGRRLLEHVRENIVGK